MSSFYFWHWRICVLMRLNKGAFQGCSGLKSVVIPNSVKSIGSSAFYGCNVTDIYITDIGAWCDISGIKELMSYGSKNKKIYLNGTEIKDLVIPNGVTSIDSQAFYCCTNLTSVVIPDSVTSIGQSAFHGCTSLVSVTIGNSVTSIGQCAFDGCTSLTSVVIPDSVTSIGLCAFGWCTRLTSVIIGNSVTSIGQDVFYDCKSLTSIVIPDSVTSIGTQAFSNCSSLREVYYTGSEKQWNAITNGGKNDSLYAATRYYYSETEPQGEGNYWHYVDGQIVKW